MNDENFLVLLVVIVGCELGDVEDFVECFVG